ncbi:hypothetical protein PBY51_024995 [Eleginops maclovinus]|uniref:Uncharacterized protein n=1 Tax=Eleginops maclovinus TaxID=56733 RepID=A0AAN7XZR5_ELEMC|nr:hypothetical protein PBY51_024995 [Eleginops maclovinus]
MPWSLSPLDAYDWARQLVFSMLPRTENGDLLRRVKELTDLLEKAKEQKKRDEERNTKLCNSLQYKVNENESLRRHVAFQNGQIHAASCLLNRERAEKTLHQELVEMKVKMVHQKSLEEELVKQLRDTRRELERVRASRQEIHQNYEAQLKEERGKTDGLQQQVERDMKSNADRMSEFKQQVKRLKAELEELRENKGMGIQWTQHEALETKGVIRKKVGGAARQTVPDTH